MLGPDSARSPMAGLAFMTAIYGGLRVLFALFEATKVAFILPTGWLVSGFVGEGVFRGGEWFFGAGRTLFVLGESCSGTTFFSLLFAFLALRVRTHGLSIAWLFWAWPIACVANAVRVVSSMTAHVVLCPDFCRVDAIDLSESAHVVTGTVTFLIVFIATSVWVERREREVSAHV